MPQLYPVGQHPAVGPALEGQMDHPLAHVASDDVAEAGTSLAGTTTVTPLEMIVVEVVVGHDVV